MSLSSSRRRTGQAVDAPLRLMPVAFAAALLVGGSAALAQPVTNALPVINAGQASQIGASIGAQGGTVQAPVMNINQTGSRAVMSWQSFDIGAAARVNVSQPSTQSILINRVTGGSSQASQIFGQLASNGRVILINPAGVTFGANAQVNVGSLVASTLDLAPSMIANDYALALNPQTNTLLFQTGNGALQVAPTATIQANPDGGGSVVLVGNQTVSQGGTIDALRGHIAVGGGSSAQVVLPASNSGFIDLVITGGTTGASITMGSASRTRAEGGSIVLGGGANSIARNEFISVNGEVNAGSTTGAGGSIRVDASSNGSVALNSTGGLNASSSAAGQAGGSIDVVGRSIALFSPGNLLATPTHQQGTVDASGMSSGGTVTIGGTDTRSLQVDDGVRVLADANGAGNGGRIALRATYLNPNATSPAARVDYGVAEIYGNLFARGGVNGGNGGTIETSGQALLTRMNDTQAGFVAAVATDARARHSSGTAGTWNIDPFNVTISSATTSGISGSWTPTGPGANVNAADITASLNAGTSVDINTGIAAAGNQAGTITVAPGTSIQRTTAGAPVTLTLRAHSDITLDNASLFAVGGAPVNVNLFSDLDGNGTGSIGLVNNTQISTGGGNFVAAGGLDPTTGFATSNGQRAGVTVNASRIDASSTGTNGNVTIRGAAAAGSADTGIAIGSNSTLAAQNLTLSGRAEQGIGTSITNSFLTDVGTGLMDVRGVATRTSGLSNRAVGVNIASVDIDLGTGSLVIAGRADDARTPGTFPAATGVQYNRLNIRTAGNTTGRIAIAGEAANSTGAGLTFNDVESGGLDIRGAGQSGQFPTLASVSLGAISSDGLAFNLGTSTSNGVAVLSGSSVNIRPVGVDANGQLVEQTTAPITVGNVPAATSGFIVDPTVLRLGSSITAAQGISIGSSAHAGAIDVQNGALSGQSATSFTLQNQGAGSQGITLGDSIDVRDLGLLTAGNVTQTAPLTVARDLVVQGGAASQVDLTQAGNTVGGNVAFSGVNRLNLLVDGPLTIGNNNAITSFNAGTRAAAPVTLTASSLGSAATLRSGAALTVAHGISATGAGQIDLVSPTAIDAGTQVINPNGGYARAWAPAVSGMLGRLNLYGCLYADCSLSGITPPPTGLQALFPTRPSVTVVADPRSGTVGQALPPLTFTSSGLVNGDTAATALSGALATAATQQSPAGAYAITQGTVASPTGYIVNYTPASLTLTGTLPVAPSDTGRDLVRTAFLAEYRSDVYGRNLSLPFICTAASVVRDSVARDILADPLASEWGKVRNQPQLSGCLEVTSGGQCAAF